jgi:hypothetical protein
MVQGPRFGSEPADRDAVVQLDARPSIDRTGSCRDLAEMCAGHGGNEHKFAESWSERRANRSKFAEVFVNHRQKYRKFAELFHWIDSGFDEFVDNMPHDRRQVQRDRLISERYCFTFPRSRLKLLRNHHDCSAKTLRCVAILRPPSAISLPNAALAARMSSEFIEKWLARSDSLQRSRWCLTPIRVLLQQYH